MKKKVEVFTAGCLVCNPIVDLVKSTVCEDCDVIIYNLIEQCETKECLAKVTEYGITKIPAIAVDGKVLECCKTPNITKEDLILAGIGKNK